MLLVKVMRFRPLFLLSRLEIFEKCMFRLMSISKGLCNSNMCVDRRKVFFFYYGLHFINEV